MSIIEKIFIHSHQRIIAILHDIVVIPLAWFGAYWLRFNLDIPEQILQQALLALPFIMAMQMIAYWCFGLYRGIWRFASIPDLIRIVKAALLASLMGVLLFVYLKPTLVIPRSIYPLYCILLIVLLGGARFFYRWLKDYGGLVKAKRVLVIGAGQAGEGIIRDLLRDSNKQYKPVGIVDDRKNKMGQEIHGIRVLGNCEQISELVQQYRIELIIIAIPSAGSAIMRRIVECCEKSGVPFRTLPSISDITSGIVKIDALREVSLEDLLGRDPVSLDWESIHKGIENKVVMITGGGGSIGLGLCRQIAQIGPKELIVIEKNEYNLYLLKLELAQKFPEINFYGYLGDVADQVATEKILQTHTIDIIFHAAAYKHVPMLESQVRIAVCNNVLGTRNLAECAIRAKIGKFVLISTDKAINPTNVMGATKRVAEIICQNYNQYHSTQFITVRFGNVLGSAGSVVPLFRKQIEQGGPITVTHPDITRFFMTIPEAAQLILQATVMGEGGEIFVLDMGEPIKITYLAEQMIHLSGLTPYKDIDIKFIGLRPGEKLREELFYTNEKLLNTSHQKILRARCSDLEAEHCLQVLDEMEIACQHYDENRLLYLLIKLVPEYRTQVHEAKLQFVHN